MKAVPATLNVHRESLQLVENIVLAFIKGYTVMLQVVEQVAGEVEDWVEACVNTLLALKAQTEKLEIAIGGILLALGVSSAEELLQMADDDQVFNCLIVY